MKKLDTFPNSIETEYLIREWADEYRRIEKLADDAKRILGSDPESPFLKQIYATFFKYTDVLSLHIGDDWEWMSWFALENELGRKKLEAKAPDWKDLRPISNAKTLAKLIVDCR